MSTATDSSWFKVALVWVGALVGSVTLQDWVFLLTGIYTVLQIYILVRDKIARHRKE